MLTNSEKQTYDILKQYFDHIVLVLNVGSMIQLNNIEKDQKTSILISYYPGMEAGNAIVDVLVGDVNPSAHLTSTWAKTINDYPTTSTFIENINYVKYKEGLFVGYRYFEEDENTQSKVVFPFGHGLSYTTFKLENNCTFDKDKKLFIVNSIVKNTGKVKGKQVVQVYAKKPQNENFVKVKRELVAFGKTKDIEGGQSETLTMTFDLNYLSSYDDLNVTGHKACYILEKGDYEIYVGDSIAATRDNKNLVFTYSHNETTVLECFTNKLTPNDKDVENANIKPNFDDLFTENDFDSYNQNQEKGKLRLLSTIDENMNIFNDENKKIINLQEEINEINFKSVLENKYTMKQLVEAMTDEELAFLSYGKNGHIFMADGAFGGNYKEDMTGKYNIPYVDTDDGPAGLRQADEKMQSTAFPAASALASSFDLEMMEKIGEIIGKEARYINVHVWLAPAINIHRNPLCGRNFEYFSEDPYLSGKLAAALIKGVQSKRVAATIKHFALNNKETNRKESDSRCSERVIREIYLKGFEIAIKESNPWSVMTAYNRINGILAGENYELVTGILRDEWKYDGLVMTDWDANSKNDKEAHAGTSVKMPRNKNTTKTILEGLKQGTVTREELERNILYELNMIAKTSSIDSLFS